MKIKFLRRAVFLSQMSILLFASSTHAQLNTTFERLFNHILHEDLFTDAFNGGNFAKAAAEANQSLTPALNTLIATNVSSFPLASTIAGINFVRSSSSRAPEMVVESLGPIFAETAKTIGRGRINCGLTYAYYNLSRFRGLATEDLRFTILSQDLSGDGTIGDIPIENETIDLFPDLNIQAHTVVLFTTLGITKNFDIGMAAPFINLNLSGTAKAVINSTSFFDFGAAFNNFNNDPANPDLVDYYAYDESYLGLGDLALRLKYSFLQDATVDLAAFVDVRFPTGEQEGFLGTGKANARFSWIVSKKSGNFSPHLNLGYDRRGLKADSDELEFIIGFDQKLTRAITFALDFLGEYELNHTGITFPGTKTIISQIEKNNLPPARREMELDLTNIPANDQDHVLNASIGFRMAPSESFSGFANIILPMNDGGLRSGIAPTFGLAVSF